MGNSSGACSAWKGPTNGRGAPHGRGVIEWPLEKSGDREEGEMVDGVRTGRWVITKPDGSKSEGEIVAGKKEGLWVLTSPDGEVSQQEWRSGDAKRVIDDSDAQVQVAEPTPKKQKVEKPPHPESPSDKAAAAGASAAAAGAGAAADPETSGGAAASASIPAGETSLLGLSAKELKALAASSGVDIVGCVEKEDLIECLLRANVSADKPLLNPAAGLPAAGAAPPASSAPGKVHAAANRWTDVALETFEKRGPIPGLMGQQLVSLEEALANVDLKDKRYYLDTAKFEVHGENGLSDDEARALYLYSCEWEKREESLYFRLNAALRDRDRSKAGAFVPFTKLLCTAMSKIMRPTTGILWRGVGLDLEAPYRLKRGRTIVFWGFTSTTTRMEALDAFIPDDSAPRTLFSISAGLAADLGPYSAYPEAEVLMPAGNVFEVINVKKFSSTLTIVELKATANVLGLPV
uniref:NAD(P)(+)--arginine ADP-ribosyltransferase n=1 Tax=Cryptomonas curvata TaxID=233186 RepID=A0A7S0QHI7_9CRYP|mmetsp:Transcript_28902/g.60709  ORF Transcript_28902/g.60709 Transcript_28902/m.60709 type:complete len:463 (+) Transcript_28902:578-1966(+)